jgi:GNAT superfamily N-acetyltransferase
MKNGLTFQEMNEGEEKEIFELVRAVFEEYVAPDFSPEGVANFGDFILPDSVLQRKNSGRYFLITAKDGNQIVGMIEMQDCNHVCLLFVSKAYHNRGIARELFKTSLEKCRILKEGSLEEIEVNASRYAVPVYEKLGFTKTGDEQIKNGILFTPMKANPQRIT